ncbi:MAG: beta-galactosidase, partial [Phycisphaerales bacterium]
MPSITFDGQSLLLDGRRHWLVAAQVCYATVPRALWADRLRAAKQAGFNAVLVPCPWNAHEIRPNVFDFEGERDIRTFLETVGELGMHAILRVGPAIGEGWDLSGIPAWAPSLPHPPKTEPDPKIAKLRGGAPEFLEAVSRWFSNLASQVKTLQVSQSGPIALVQVEHHWFCGDDDAANRYLVELGRFLRESGFNVPFVNANNLFQPVEGEIDGWSGSEHLLAMFRQMRVVSPQNPRLLIDSRSAPITAWGEQPTHADPLIQQRRLAEAAAAGAQIVYSRFSPGSYPEFFAGRRAGSPDGYICAHAGESGAMVTSAGLRTPEFFALKRLATFSSRFGRVLAALESDYQPVGILPGGVATSVVHTAGQRGSVAFVFAPEGHTKPLDVDLLLPDGRSMTVTTGDQRCAWFLFDAHLHARSTLDFCSLQPFAQVGRVFVCYGPAGRQGLLSINGAELPVEVPTGKTPHIEELENTVVVVCNEAMIDATYAADNAVHIGVAGLDADDHPVAHPDFRTHFVISAEGKVEK